MLVRSLKGDCALPLVQQKVEQKQGAKRIGGTITENYFLFNFVKGALAVVYLVAGMDSDTKHLHYCGPL